MQNCTASGDRQLTGSPKRSRANSSCVHLCGVAISARARCTIWGITAAGLAIAAPQSKNANGAPRYVVDPFWPKDLPENWTLGQVAGIAVDNQDNVWIVHRPRTLVDDEKGAMKTPPETRCCKPA